MGAVTDAVMAELTPAEISALGEVKIGGAVSEALLYFSTDFPRERAQLCAVDGDGVVTLPDGWVEGWSVVSALGYPVATPESTQQHRFNLEAEGTVAAGQPVYITAGGLLALAQADAAPRFNVIGLCAIGAAAGFAAAYSTDGSVSLSDWTAITGTAQLTAGQEYYLSADAPGMLSSSPPPTGHVVSVGTAISSSELDIEIQYVAKL